MEKNILAKLEKCEICPHKCKINRKATYSL